MTHVLSLLDPETPEPEDFKLYPAHERLTLRFHDILAPVDGLVAPEREHVAQILDFGRDCAGHSARGLLVHCHMGLSRSTAATVALLLLADPAAGEDEALAEVAKLRPQAWPNSRIIAFADELLGRRGKLVHALANFYRVVLQARPRLIAELRASGRDAEVDMAEAPPLFRR